MARIRTIKPEFWDSPATARASLRARLFFIAMWNWANDDGIGDANARKLVSFAFPNDEEITAADFPSLSKEVQSVYEVVFFSYKQRPYFVIPTWNEHQKTERRARRDEGLFEAAQAAIEAHDSGEVEPVEEMRGFSSTSLGNSGAGTGEQGNRGTEEQGNSNPPNPPRGKRGQRLPENWSPQEKTVETIMTEYPSLDYMKEHKRFVDYWIAQPGQKGVKADWDATWRNWMRRKGDEVPKSTGAWMNRSIQQSKAEQAHGFIERLKQIDDSRGSGQVAHNSGEFRQQAIG